MSEHLDQVEALCRRVYSETREFYSNIEPALGERACGCKILYGPPMVRRPVLFIGFQPGGTREDEQRGERDGWKPDLEYVTERWELAANIRRMWCSTDLKACAGMNAIFIRCQDSPTWAGVPIDLRNRVKQFCLPRVQQMVTAMQPNRVVAIGMKTMRLFDRASVPDVVNDRGEVLTRTGRIGDVPALATLHLSGYRIRAVDRLQIAARVGLRLPR